MGYNSTLHFKIGLYPVKKEYILLKYRATEMQSSYCSRLKSGICLYPALYGMSRYTYFCLFHCFCVIKLANGCFMMNVKFLKITSNTCYEYLLYFLHASSGFVSYSFRKRLHFCAQFLKHYILSGVT